MFASCRRLPPKRCFAGVVRDPSPKRRCVSPTQSPKHNFPTNAFALKAPSLGALNVFLSTTVIPNVCMYAPNISIKTAFLWKKVNQMAAGDSQMRLHLSRTSVEGSTVAHFRGLLLWVTVYSFTGDHPALLVW
ncbi:hypothetical protein GOODEAATRI_024028 [Goodea atripinnis]|uniref:Uncharacterized protein n=1 Tax=Goodea atripinnis TaxID=208336 RepID=A0ABV0MKD0_9TELE